MLSSTSMSESPRILEGSTLSSFSTTLTFDSECNRETPTLPLESQWTFGLLFDLEISTLRFASATRSTLGSLRDLETSTISLVSTSDSLEELGIVAHNLAVNLKNDMHFRLFEKSVQLPTEC